MKHTKNSVDEIIAEQRLVQGRLDAGRIIKIMAEKGVTVKLFGSMSVGNVNQYSDIDLLITDSGPMHPFMALHEVELLSGNIPLDVTILEYVPERSLKCVLETVYEH